MSWSLIAGGFKQGEIMGNMLVTEFQETQKLLWENDELRRLTRFAVMCTRGFPEKFDTTRVMGTQATTMSVTDETVLTAARRLWNAHCKVAILNFANGVNPGGGVIYGADTREERLCRYTNLYPCLTKPEIYEEFYHYNNQLDRYYSDRIIYSENITVLKNDNPAGMYDEEWFMVDVISCPAPNLGGVEKVDFRRLEKVLNSRIRNIFAVAEAHGVRALVLGDFGCGIYRNPPELVARAFLEQMTRGDYKNTFREVVFPISTQSPESYQINAIFRDILCPWQKNPIFGKRISILGDSLSTFWGCNPSGFPVYYEGERCMQSGVYTWENTWWYQVLCHFDSRLLVNNSYANTTVCGSSRYSGNSDFRTWGLHTGWEQPEVLLVCMGIWDFLMGLPIEPENGSIAWEGDYDRYFRPSYEIMLWKLKTRYPMAEIYCQTLCPPLVLGTRSPLTVVNAHSSVLEDYNAVIRGCAMKYGCRVAEVSSYVLGYETIDQFHADARGMRTLADGWIQALEENITCINKAGTSMRQHKSPDISVRRRTSPGTPVHSHILSDTSWNRNILLAAAVLCLLLCLVFIVILAAGFGNGLFTNVAAACIMGILPGIFMGMSILFFWFSRNAG